MYYIVGVIRNGGAQPNIIPEETELEYYLRTPTDIEMVTLKQKVEGCVQGAALATGCTVSYKFNTTSYLWILEFVMQWVCKKIKT